MKLFTQILFSRRLKCVRLYKRTLKPIAAISMLSKSIDQAIENLTTMPEAFTKIKFKYSDDVVLCYIACGNYMIVYYVEKSKVVLFRFLYSRSDTKNRINN